MRDRDGSSDWMTHTLRMNRAAAWPDEPVREIAPDEWVFIPEALHGRWYVTLCQFWRVEKGDLYLLREDPLDRLTFSDRTLIADYPIFLLPPYTKHVAGPFWRCRQTESVDDPIAPRPEAEVWPLADERRKLERPIWERDAARREIAEWRQRRKEMHMDVQNV